ncbi:MAG TPA: EAL domain-containing protein [Coriobacteriia bacterium]|nr:EAL domain-containing protein [Coriobacteriia bacterium]
MGLRARVIVVLSVVVLFMAAVTYAVGSSIVSHAVETREALEVQSTLSRVDSAIKVETGQLVRTSKDWATWDDSYGYMADHNESFIRSNLSGTALGALGVDFMLFIDQDGTPVSAIQAGKSGQSIENLDPDMLDYLVNKQGLARVSAKSAAISGLVAPGDKPALIATRPILRSDGSGPARGTFVIGRFVRSEQGRQVSAIVGEKVQITPIATNAAGAGWHRPDANVGFLTRHFGGESIQGQHALKGIDGTPVAVVTITQPRTTRVLVEQSTKLVIIYSILAVTLMLIALVLTIDHTVLRRLSRLGTEVQAIAERRATDVRVHVNGDDEITVVAKGVNDMLSSLHDAQTEARYLAEHDVLTGLANRRRFEQELDRQLSAHRRFGRGFAVLWFDLDRFKDINDSFGHAAGDQLLALLAETLKRESRDYTSVARIGGDEFAILIPEADEREAVLAAERIVGCISGAEYEIAGHLLQVHVSVGVAMCPDDAASADALLAYADVAMYHAKSAGGNQVYRHSAEGHGELSERVTWAARVSAALRDDRFTLLAMPTMNLKTGEPGSYELLLRMIDDDGRLISPTAFIAAAESSALIDQLDAWVLRTALGLIGYERSQNRETRFTVNISAAGLHNAALPSLLSEAAAHDIDVSKLTVEVRETAAVADLEAARRFSEFVRELGVGFALDDFGTGTASFHYLKHLPVDVLKIDGGLIRGLDSSGGDQYFVKAIVEMCKGLEITTVAEYVENEVALAHVRAAGIEFAQGYVISQPQALGSFGIGPKAPPGKRRCAFELGPMPTRLADSI